MKTKQCSKTSILSCTYVALAWSVLIDSSGAQSPPVNNSSLRVGDGSGLSIGDGTFAAEGKFNTSMVLPSAYQTAGSRMLWYPRISAFRVGYGNQSTWNASQMGAYSFSSGYNNIANGYCSSAFGWYNLASGPRSTTFGIYNTSSGESSVTFGEQNISSGPYSSTFGRGNVADGNSSTAMGVVNIADGGSSFAVGSLTTTSGYGSVAMGYNLTASSFAETVIGTRNQPILGNLNEWRANDPVFQIGNGHDDLFEINTQEDLNGDGIIGGDMTIPDVPATNSNALTVYKNGNMELQGNLTLGGTITSGGSPVMTEATASSSGLVTSSNLQNQVQELMQNYSVALSSSYAPGEYATAMSTGQALANFSTAMTGGIANAGSSVAMSFGYTNAYYSTAMSGASTFGDYSTAVSGASTFGEYSTAVSGGYAYGAYSFSSGYSADAVSFCSSSFGSYNDSWGDQYAWVETDPVLLVGNGHLDENSQPEYSNALAVLKNGKTTLTNKAWKANPSVEPTEENSQGEALVVDGHTRLRGKVVIEQPQGDISMGIYGTDPE